MPDDEASKFIATSAEDATPKLFSIGRLLPWVGLWAVAIAAILALALRGYALEDLQTLFFPVVLCVFWRISVSAGICLPRGLLLVAMSFWLVGALHVRGYYPAELFREGVYLGRLADDSSGVAARELYQRYNQISEHYGLSPMRLIHRSLGDENAMDQWMVAHPQVGMLIGGDANWLQVSLPPRELSATAPAATVRTEDSSLALARTVYKIQPNVGLRAAGIPNAEVELLLVLNPPSIRVPSAPTELTRHYLAWLAKGLSSDFELMSSGVPKPLEALFPEHPKDELIREVRLFHFGNSSFVDGPWKTYAPRGLSLFYEANIALQESLAGNTNPAALSYISGLYAKASGSVRERYEPELFSAIHNNAAVAYLLLGSEEEHFQKARKLFGEAISSRSRTGDPASIAGVPLINLRIAETLGLIAE